MRTKTLILGILGAALLLAPTVAAKHSISITNANEAAPGTFTVEVDVDSFDLVPFQGREAKVGEGHIHYLVNGVDACSAEKADCDAATDYATTATSFTFKDLEEGDTIGVELVLSDHGASGTDSNGNRDPNKRVTDSAEVTADNDAPGLPLVALLAGIVGLAMLRRR